MLPLARSSRLRYEVPVTTQVEPLVRIDDHAVVDRGGRRVGDRADLLVVGSAGWWPACARRSKP